MNKILLAIGSVLFLSPSLIHATEKADHTYVNNTNNAVWFWIRYSSGDKGHIRVEPNQQGTLTTDKCLSDIRVTGDTKQRHDTFIFTKEKNSYCGKLRIELNDLSNIRNQANIIMEDGTCHYFLNGIFKKVRCPGS